MWFRCSKEPSHWHGSFEYQQHTFWLRNKKNNFPVRTLIRRIRRGIPCLLYQIRSLNNSLVYKGIRCILHVCYLLHRRYDMKSSQTRPVWTSTVVDWLLDCQPYLAHRLSEEMVAIHHFEDLVWHHCNLREIVSDQQERWLQMVVSTHQFPVKETYSLCQSNGTHSTKELRHPK